MSKKWLYGVALGALLIAQSSLGVTVHEVLSKGFFSEAEHRATLESLASSEGEYARKVKNLKPKDGMERALDTYKSNQWSPSKWKWKGVWSFTNDGESDCVYNLKNKQKHHIEKTKGNQHQTEDYANEIIVRAAQETSVVKSKGKGTRPLGPFVVHDWLPDTLSSNHEEVHMQFNGTEETATTNIVSDTEAYITRTIRQSGWIQDCFGFVVEEPASLLRTYNMHITTDADHVYIHQDINETALNAYDRDTQHNYTEDYTATFKNDRCVRETATIQKNETDQTSAWVKEFYKGDEATDVATVSVNTQSSLKAKHARLARTDDSKQRSQ